MISCDCLEYFFPDKRVQSVTVCVESVKLRIGQRDAVHCFRIRDESIGEVWIVAKVDVFDFDGEEVDIDHVPIVPRVSRVCKRNVDLFSCFFFYGDYHANLPKKFFLFLFDTAPPIRESIGKSTRED